MGADGKVVMAGNLLKQFFLIVCFEDVGCIDEKTLK
jgi:hypothetical protein